MRAHGTDARKLIGRPWAYVGSTPITCIMATSNENDPINTFNMEGSIPQRTAEAFLRRIEEIEAEQTRLEAKLDIVAQVTLDE